jgi:hypothetical protein
MSISYKLYFFLGILFFIEASNYTQDEAVKHVATAEACSNSHDEKEKTVDIDAEFIKNFDTFLDTQDNTSFSTIIQRIIEVLHFKAERAHGPQKHKCLELIKIFEKNKNNLNLLIWINIFKENLRLVQDVMSENTRTYINNIQINTLLNALLVKLNKK